MSVDKELNFDPKEFVKIFEGVLEKEIFAEFDEFNQNNIIT